MRHQMYKHLRVASLWHTCRFKEGILKQQNFTGISLVVKMLKIEPLSPSPIIPLVGLCRIHTVLDSLRGLLVFPFGARLLTMPSQESAVKGAGSRTSSCWLEISILIKSYFQISFPIQDGRHGVGWDTGTRELAELSWAGELIQLTS